MDDQHLKDEIAGQKLRDILVAVNQSRPAIQFRDGVLYVPMDDREFWRQVAQRQRLAADR